MYLSHITISPLTSLGSISFSKCSFLSAAKSKAIVVGESSPVFKLSLINLPTEELEGSEVV
jgi:hypothetical protein